MMAIVMRLDRLLAERKMRSNELARMLDLTPVTLSRMKTGKMKAIRYDTMDSLCQIFECQPGDIFEYVPDAELERMFGPGKKGPPAQEE